MDAPSRFLTKTYMTTPEFLESLYQLTRENEDTFVLTMGTKILKIPSDNVSSLLTSMSDKDLEKRIKRGNPLHLTVDKNNQLHLDIEPVTRT